MNALLSHADAPSLALGLGALAVVIALAFAASDALDGERHRLRGAAQRPVQIVARGGVGHRRVVGGHAPVVGFGQQRSEGILEVAQDRGRTLDVLAGHGRRI